MPVVLSDNAVARLIDILHVAIVAVPGGLNVIGAELFQLNQKVNSMSGDISSQVNQELESLKSDVAAQTSEVASVRVAFSGISQQLADALAAAKAAGATQAQLAAIQAVHQSLLANTQGLVEAVAQGTPSAGQTGTTDPASSGATDPASGDATVSGGASDTGTVQ